MERPLPAAPLTAALSYFFNAGPCCHFSLSPADYGASPTAFPVENPLAPGTLRALPRRALLRSLQEVEPRASYRLVS